MASTLLSDVIIPAIYLSYTAVDGPELTAFYQSGVLVRNPVIENAFSGGGQVATMPFWKDLDASGEPNYSNDDPASVAVPDKTSADKMQARIAFMNKSYSAADLVGQLAGSSPMQHIRNRFGTYWSRVFQHRLLKTMTGLYLENVANGASDMILNLATEDGNNAAAGNLFARGAFTGAVFTLGDAFGKITAIAVHSLLYKRMVDNDDIEFIKDSTGTIEIPTYLGKRVIVDDGMPAVAGSTSGFKFTSILFGEGMIGYGEKDAPVPMEVYRRPDQGNGGGVEQLIERKGMILHPHGYVFTSASIAGVSATNAEMALAANWTRVIERKNVPLAFLVTNG